jgi:predicted O-methyltransferase YrrM
MEHSSNPGRRAVLGAPVAAAALLSVPAMARGRRRAVERPPLAASAEERRILAVLEDVYRKHRYLSVPEPDGRLLRVLVESIGARHVVEIGTSTGYSGLWILLGLAKTQGRLTTYEIDRGRHEMARGNFEKAGMLAQVTPVLGNAHEEVKKLKGPIDLVFIDADKEGYLDYWRSSGHLSGKAA